MQIKISAIILLCISIHCHSMDTLDTLIAEVQEDLHKMKHDIGTVIGVVAPELGQHIIGQEYPAIKNNPYKHTDAYVRQSADICDGEKEYLKHRLPVAKAAQEKLLGRRLENHQTLTIAMSGSGGGYRAALVFLGALLGAKKIGILDAITYMPTLSGSTGTAISLISTKLPLKFFKEYILDRVTQPFTNPSDEEELLIMQAAAVKSFFGQKKGPVDLYGDLLGNTFLEHFKDQRHIVYLSDQADIIKDGSFPYPIYTAVDGDETIAENPTWYEYTPHEIGNPIDKTYIPTWAYGRKFKDGKSVKGSFDTYPPEKNISYNLGTFWSAFGANNHLIKEEIAKRFGGKVGEFIEHFAPSLDGERPLDVYGEIPNYMYKMKQLDNPQLAQAKMSKRVDAGTAYNTPLLPVNRPGRQADVIFICDASADQIGDQLKKAVADMQRHNLPFPRINFDTISKKTMSVFKEEDPNVPVVIYVPRISDKDLWNKHKEDPQYAKYNLSGFDLERETFEGFASTIHFQYTRENAEKVVNQMEFNMRVNQAKVIKALNFAVDRKKMQ